MIMGDELVVKKRKLLQNAIIFGVGCVGLAAFFLIGIFVSKDTTVLALDLLFAIGLGLFSYQSFKGYKILKDNL
jgi:hypothetical protein